MTTFQQLREGVTESLDNLLQGWRHLADRASGALTKFIPVRRNDEKHESANAISRPSVRWGLLAAEVFDDDDKLVVKLEAPGMDAEDFDIQIRNEVLIVRGEKKFQHEQNKGNYHLMECAYGCFERAIPLPEKVDEEKAQASYKRGLLNITLPKTGLHTSRKIKVTAV